MSTILEVRDVAKAFGGVHALNGCSFTVEEGSITGLIGPNGSGKTTLFNTVTGYVHPDAGQITFRGSPIHGLNPDRVFAKGLGRTFQQVRVFPRLSVIENVLVAFSGKGWRHAIRRASQSGERERAIEILEYVDLLKLADIPAGSLSWGQKKLLEFATLLIADPKMILLDEPAGGINPSMVRRIDSYIRDLNKRGITFLVVEHNMSFVMSLCEEVVVMGRGRTVTQGDPDAVRQNPEVLEAYLGS